jgi:hypothetical protein
MPLTDNERQRLSYLGVCAPPVPHQAQLAYEEFASALNTVSLSLIAKRRGADIERDGPVTTYTFDDDTTLVVTGRGRTHKVQVELP